MKHQYLGKDITYNVYAIELKGIATTLEIVKENDVKYITCEINTDSQAAIKAVIKSRQQSRQQIIKRMLNILEEIKRQKPKLKIMIKWVSGHQNIAGNEKADVEAK